MPRELTDVTDDGLNVHAADVGQRIVGARLLLVEIRAFPAYGGQHDVAALLISEQQAESIVDAICNKLGWSFDKRDASGT